MFPQRNLKFSEAYYDVIFLDFRFFSSLNCELVSKFLSFITDLTHCWILEELKDT